MSVPDGVLEAQGPGIPVPRPSLFTQPYWDGCRVGELRYQQCSCGVIAIRPGSICRACFGSGLSWRVSAGLGALVSWTVVWRPQHPAFKVPYAPAVVELDEGYRWLSSVIGCSVSDLRAGLRLAVEFHPVGDLQLPYFRPTEEGLRQPASPRVLSDT